MEYTYYYRYRQAIPHDILRIGYVSIKQIMNKEEGRNDNEKIPIGGMC
jgi:hypothetical protein